MYTTSIRTANTVVVSAVGITIDYIKLIFTLAALYN
ncbi:hypothetical protein PF005_g27183 [Phytophthora fragariae]|uniref:Uncharacterized protein n=1 Tax=Phytophthora fragariae TaxID=53985 RepID=A0A6A4BM44_9STRA|nr:hypothetical protein PF009_g30054 [Phytophthora fragariae]KAE8971441.1 hypothetical protein PF011_g26032 [Phytophthora fragariae]KAE9069412.1 hypothetical protein PF010_g26674 [Phytophthora fragariae]KAE9070983.1 hypothetical protein PF007_g26726 [Phytophthora fragariae]KAE9082577.1 hypothetical protein PF006_g26876 [Phytophthora fragariae]